MKYFKTRLAIDRRYWLMTLLFVVIVNVDLLLVAKQRQPFSGQFLTFLAGESLGHYTQMALLWLLPAYLLIGPSRWYLQDIKVGQLNLLVTRLAKRHYLKGLLITAFSSVSSSMLLALLSNYGASLIVFRHGHGNSYPMEIFNDGFNPFLHWQLLHPILVNMGSIFIASVFIGLLASALLALSLIFKKTSYVFAISMVAWFIPISTNYSLMSVFQPFQETPLLTQLVIMYVYLLVFLAIIYWGYQSEVRRDEL